MKPIRWLSAAAAATLISTLALPLTGEAAPRDDEETPMHQQMEVIEDGLKSLRRGLRKPENNPQSLETVLAMQQAAWVCKGLEPAMMSSVPEAERAQFLADYRKDMAICMKAMLDLEIALLDGDNEKAQELYKTLKIQEDEGHEKFTEDG